MRDFSNLQRLQCPLEFHVARRLAPSSASGARGPRSLSEGLGQSGGGAWGKRGFGTPIRLKELLDVLSHFPD